MFLLETLSDHRDIVMSWGSSNQELSDSLSTVVDRAGKMYPVTEQPFSFLRVGITSLLPDAVLTLDVYPVLQAVAPALVQSGISGKPGHAQAQVSWVVCSMGCRCRDCTSGIVSCCLVVTVRSPEWNLDHASCLPMVTRGVYNRQVLHCAYSTLVSDSVHADPAESVEHDSLYVLTALAAEGCNIIIAASGAGDIVDCPFVPTLKFVSASRCQLLSAVDLDPRFTEESRAMKVMVLENIVSVARGRPTVGEADSRSRPLIFLPSLSVPSDCESPFEEQPFSVLMPATVCGALLRTCRAAAWELNKTARENGQVFCLPVVDCDSEQGVQQTLALARGLAKSALSVASSTDRVRIVFLAHASCPPTMPSLEREVGEFLGTDSREKLVRVSVSDDAMRTTLSE
jgi:hypothetical protein